MDKRTFLDLAYSDLQSSKVLFESNNYPQSVFHMQQSVEKLGKFLALSYGVHTEKKLKAIGHNTLKIFQDVLKHFIDMINTISEKYRFERINLSILEEQFKIITDTDLQNLDDENLDSVLSSLADLENPEPFIEFNGEKDEILDQFLELSIDLKQINEEEIKSFKEEYNSNAVFQQIIHEKLEGFFKYFDGYIAASESAFSFAIVFTRHAVATRYGTEFKNPLSTYTSEHPLVKRLPKFQYYLDLAIDRCIKFDSHGH